MRIFIATAFLTLAGCQEFTDLEEACHDVVPGEKSVDNNNAVGIVNRTNCYRRLVSLPRGRVQKQVQASVEAHTSYVGTNLPSFERLELEQGTLAGYTGYDVFARLEDAGYEWSDDSTDMGVWELAVVMDDELWEGTKPFVDRLADDVYSRQILLQPSWVAAGADMGTWEEGTTYVNYVVVYSYPSEQRATKPIVYPKDGQVKVPTAYLQDHIYDPLCGEVTGYPISITVGSEVASSGSMASANPYGLEVLNAGLHGPGGAIPLDVRAPGDLERPSDFLTYTVALTPLRQLEPNASYTLEAAIRSVDGDMDVTVTFKTASERTETIDPGLVWCEEFDGALPTFGGTPTGGTTTGGTTTGGTTTGGTTTGTTIPGFTGSKPRLVVPIKTRVSPAVAP